MSKPVRLAILPEIALSFKEVRGAYIFQNRFALVPASVEPILREEQHDKVMWEVETETTLYIAFVCNNRNSDRFYRPTTFIAILPELPGGQNPINVVEPGKRLVLERIDPLINTLNLEKVITDPVTRVYNVYGGEVHGVWCIETERAKYYFQNI